MDSLARVAGASVEADRPRAYVLYCVGEGFGAEAFKLAVKELVARRALRVEPVETRGWHGQQYGDVPVLRTFSFAVLLAVPAPGFDRSTRSARLATSP